MSDSKNKSKKREFQVHVLGVPYKICMGKLTDYPILKDNNSSGLCDASVKTIWVHDTSLDKPEVGDLKNQKYMRDITLRHELMHAFFQEAGLEDYSDNERLVNFVALMMPKILKVFKDAGCLSEDRKAA